MRNENCNHGPEYQQKFIGRQASWCRICNLESRHATLEEAQQLAYNEDTVRTLLPALLSALESNEYLSYQIMQTLRNGFERYSDL